MVGLQLLEAVRIIILLIFTSDAKLEVLSNNNIPVSVQNSSEVLTIHHYAQARIYMSQALDAKNNWLASDTRDLGPIMKVVAVIEQLGIANGNGALNLMRERDLV